MSFGSSALVATARALVTADTSMIGPEMTRGAEEFRGGVGKIQGYLVDLDDAQLKAKLAQENYTKSVALNGPESDKTARALNRLQRALLEVDAKTHSAATQASISGEKFTVFGKDVSYAAYETNRLGRDASVTEGRMMGLGRSMAVGAMGLLGGVGLIQGLKGAVDNAVKFQSSMVQIGTQSGASAAEVEKMSGALMRLGVDVADAPNELTASLLQVEKSGLRGAHAIDAVRLSAQAARMSNSSLTDTTAALIATMNSGVPGIHTSTQAMALLNAIVRNGNVSMGDMASLMRAQVFSSMKLVGMNATDLGGAIDVLATTMGGNVQRAGMVFGRTITRLGAPTSAMGKSLGVLNLGVMDVANTLRNKGLVPALQLLQDHMKKSGLTASQQSTVLVHAFGQRQAMTIESLITKLGLLKTTIHGVGHDAATFGPNWKKTTQTAAYGMAQFHASTQVLSTQLGAVLLPAMMKLLGPINNWMSGVIQSGQAQKFMTHLIHETIGAATFLFGIVKDGWSVFSTLTGLVGGLKNAVIIMLAAFAVNKIRLFAAGAIKSLTNVETQAAKTKLAELRNQSEIRHANDATSRTVTLDSEKNALAQKRAAAAGATSWSTSTHQIQGDLASLERTAQTTSAGTAQAETGAATTTTSVWSRATTSVKGFLVGTAATSNVTATEMEANQAGIAVAGTTSAATTAVAWDVAMANMTAAVRAFMAATVIGILVVGISIAMTEILTHLNAISHWFKSFGKWLWDHWWLLNFLPVVGQIIWFVGEIIKHWNGLKDFFMLFAHFFRDVWTHPIRAVQDLFYGLWADLKAGLEGLINFFIGKLDDIINAYNSIAGWLTGNIPAIGKIGQQSGAAYANGIRKGIKDSLGGVHGAIAGFFGAPQKKAAGGNPNHFTGPTGGLSNPVPGGSYGRIDQGVDYVVKVVHAIASGGIYKITTGMNGGTGYIIYQQFTKGIRIHGRTYYGAYYSEGTPLVKAGDVVRAGDPVMSTKGTSSVEIGFLVGGPDTNSMVLPTLVGKPGTNKLGSNTLASPEGQDFNDLVASLGGPHSSGSGNGVVTSRGGSTGGAPPGTLTGQAGFYKLMGLKGAAAAAVAAVGIPMTLQEAVVRASTTKSYLDDVHALQRVAGWLQNQITVTTDIKQKAKLKSALDKIVLALVKDKAKLHQEIAAAQQAVAVADIKNQTALVSQQDSAAKAKAHSLGLGDSYSVVSGQLVGTEKVVWDAKAGQYKLEQVAPNVTALAAYRDKVLIPTLNKLHKQIGAMQRGLKRLGKNPKMNAQILAALRGKLAALLHQRDDLITLVNDITTTVGDINKQLGLTPNTGQTQGAGGTFNLAALQTLDAELHAFASHESSLVNSGFISNVIAASFQGQLVGQTPTNLAIGLQANPPGPTQIIIPITAVVPTEDPHHFAAALKHELKAFMT